MISESKRVIILTRRPFPKYLLPVLKFDNRKNIDLYIRTRRESDMMWFPPQRYPRYHSRSDFLSCGHVNYREQSIFLGSLVLHMIESDRRLTQADIYEDIELMSSLITHEVLHLIIYKEEHWWAATALDNPKVDPGWLDNPISANEWIPLPEDPEEFEEFRLKRINRR